MSGERGSKGETDGGRAHWSRETSSFAGMLQGAAVIADLPSKCTIGLKRIFFFAIVVYKIQLNREVI